MGRAKGGMRVHVHEYACVRVGRVGKPALFQVSTHTEAQPSRPQSVSDFVSLPSVAHPNASLPLPPSSCPFLSTFSGSETHSLYFPPAGMMIKKPVNVSSQDSVSKGDEST